MRKIAILLCLLVGTYTYAQKSYVTVAFHMDSSKENYFYLSGSIPGSMKSEYSGVSFNGRYTHKSLGELINMLANYGFTVEQTLSGSSRGFVILSKTTGNANAIQKIIKEDEEEISEVARYNLQGLPIKKEEKGIQIVVYSNYTTKTVLIQ